MGTNTGQFLHQLQNYLNDYTKGGEEVTNNFQYLNKNVGLLSGLNVPIHDITRITDAIITNNDRTSRYKEYREMTQDNALISSAIDTYADNATQFNYNTNHVFSIDNDNDYLKQDVENLIYNKLNLDEKSWIIVHDLCKNGDFFTEIVLQDDMRGVNYIKFIENCESVYRIESNKQLVCWLVDEGVVDQKRSKVESFFDEKLWNSIQSFMSNKTELSRLKILAPFQMVHFRLYTNDKDFIPYGYSLLENCRKSWKQWRLMENTMLVNCINNAPERLVFGIPIGDMDADQAMAHLERIRQRNRKKSIINAQGNLDEQASVIALDEHIFIPVPNEGEKPSVTKLDGAKNLQAVTDVVEYFKQKCLGALKLPPTFGSAEITAEEARSFLANRNIEFAKSVQRMQRQVIQGIMKVVIVDLFLKGYKEESAENVKLSMTPPSALIYAEQQENIKNKFSLVSDIKNADVFSLYKVLTDYIGLDPEEANLEIKRRRWEASGLTEEEGRIQEKLSIKSISDLADSIRDIQAKAGAGGGAGGAGGGGPITAGGSELGGGAPSGGLPGEETAGGEISGGAATEIGGTETEGAAAPETAPINASIDTTKKIDKLLVEFAKKMSIPVPKTKITVGLYEKMQRNHSTTLTFYSALNEYAVSNELFGLHKIIISNHMNNVQLLKEGILEKSDIGFTKAQKELIKGCKLFVARLDEASFELSLRGLSELEKIEEKVKESN